MSYIRIVPEDAATGVLREAYDQDIRANGFVPNYTKALSLRPEVILAWRQLNRLIRSKMDVRRYELITVASTLALKCTY